MRLLSRIETPIGDMALVHDGASQLWAAQFLDDEKQLDLIRQRWSVMPTSADCPAAPKWLANGFAAYFGGDLDSFGDWNLPSRGSPFEQAVWTALRTIPPGTTRSYGAIARAMGGAATGAGANARAVGSANARNPIAIAIPCHRVIGADGRLTGYAGGLWRKQWLLAHEGWRPDQELML